MTHPGAAKTVVEAITVCPQVLGYYIDTAGQQHGFSFLVGGGYVNIDVRGDTDTGLFGISSSMVYAAQSRNPKGKHVSTAICCITAPIKYPGSAANYAYQMNNSLLIATTWTERKSITRGGIYNFNESTYQAIDVPGANLTETRGINDNNQLAGCSQTKNSKKSLGFYTTGSP